ncbi:MAG TPA: ABC transporter permease [Thermoanaerobaculia bacterium]|jgi:putative ABC transport system permease protein|nr:ABC transporter permease [Thermoanaerobaculia bacterium]
MSWLARLRNVFRPGPLASEIDEEMRFHLEMRARSLADQGLPPQEAESGARRAFGNPLLLRERTRDADVWVGLDTLLQDVRHSFRMLRRSPGFTVAAVVTLALGIGANAAVFSVVDAVLLRPLPYPEPDRLFVLYRLNTQENIGRTRAAPLDFLDWQKRSRSFSAMAAHIGTGFTLTGGGEPEMVIGQLVSAELFDVLAARPLLGRTFRPDENEAGRDRVMLLSHRLWQRRFGGDPAVVGRTIVANNRPYTVVGVMPPGFDYPGSRYQLWVPFPFRGTNEDNLPVNRQSRYLQVIGRLEPGITPEQAAADLDRVGRQLAEEYPDSNSGTTANMISLTEDTVGGVRKALLLLLGAAGFVLLIACANVTSLLLARASTRRREMAVRSALGVGLPRLVRQLLTETLVLFAAGLVAGLLVAQGTLGAVRTVGPRDIPRLEEADLDTRALLLSATAAGVAALLFGLAPALQAARAGASGAAKIGGRVVTADPRHQRLRSAVIVAEVSVSLVLLTGAGLAVRSFLRLQGVEKGFDPDHAASFSVTLPAAKYPDAAAMRAVYRRLLDGWSSQPAFEAVGLTTALPLSGQDLENGVALEGAPDGGELPVAGLRGVSPGYFKAMGIPVRRGRSFTLEDHETSLPVAVVNQAFARRYWPGQDPIGKRLSVDGSGGPWRTVVGIVADVKHRGLETAPRPEVLLPYFQLDPGFLTSWSRGLSVVIRSSAGLSVIADLARRGVRAADLDMPLIDFQPMAQLVTESTAQPRFRTLLMGGFAAIAFILALVGVFGVMSYFVAQRTQELGVRMALGARRSQVFALVLRRGARLAALGVLIGLAGARALTGWMAGLLYEVSPTDPVTFVLAAALLTAAALAASYIPARRAAGLDPAVVLREE